MATPSSDSNGSLRRLPWFLQLLWDLATFRRAPLTYVVAAVFVIGVCIHIAWACGLLTSFGFDQGFERAEASERVERTVAWGLRLQVMREIREAAASYCHASDDESREALSNYLDSLTEGYTKATGLTINVPGCLSATSAAPPPVAPPAVPK
jgi:hypothetical protein